MKMIKTTNIAIVVIQLVLTDMLLSRSLVILDLCAPILDDLLCEKVFFGLMTEEAQNKMPRGRHLFRITLLTVINTTM